MRKYNELKTRVEREGGEAFSRPVLVRFLDTNSYQVMERSIVEDEFYVRRRFKVVKKLKG